MKRSVYMLIGSVILQVGYIIFTNIRNKNNVCKTFEDYYTDRDSNANCYYNPDYLLSVPEIIQRHGYPVETHYVTTADGHILTLFRIPHGRNTNTTKTGKPVFLQHGFVANCAGYVSAGQKSLGFILANEGYDVWLGNFRGTKYSKDHINLTRSDSAYWNFSFHEYGTYDLPALLGFVSNVTNRKITYIGFSMGTTAMYVYGVTYPEIAAEQVDLFVNFAPTVFPVNVKSPIGMMKVHQVKLVYSFIDKIEIPDTLIRYVCLPYPFQTRLCSFPFNLLVGYENGQLDPEYLSNKISHIYDIIVVKAFAHLGQISVTGKFSQFDYGAEENIRRYSTPEPPLYNLTKFKIEVYIAKAKNDLLIQEEGVEMLRRALPKDVTHHDIYEIKDESFNHLDFIYGSDVVELLYNHIIIFLRNR